jgi:hypothetical protein
MEWIWIVSESPRKAAMDVAPQNPVMEGGPAKRGKPDSQVSGVRGARGDILSKA